MIGWNPHPQRADAGGDSEWPACPGDRHQRFRGLAQSGCIRLHLVTPHDRSQMRLIETVTQPGFGDGAPKRCALDQECDGFESFCLRALGELLTFVTHLRRDQSYCRIDESEDGASTKVQQLGELIRIAGHPEGDAHPATPRHVLPCTPRLQHTVVEATADEVTGDDRRLRSGVGGHWRSGIAAHGFDPKQQVGLVTAAQRRNQRRVQRQTRRLVSERGFIDLGEKRLQNLTMRGKALRAGLHQLAYAGRRSLPPHATQTRAASGQRPSKW